MIENICRHRGHSRGSSHASFSRAMISNSTISSLAKPFSDPTGERCRFVPMRSPMASMIRATR